MTSNLSATGFDWASAANEAAAVTHVQDAGSRPSGAGSCPADMDHCIESIGDHYSAQSAPATIVGTSSIPCIYPESNTYEHRRAKSLPRLTVKQSYAPLAIVILLSLLTGIAYGWITALDGHVQAILHAKEIRTIQLQAVTYTGWFVGSICGGQFILRKFGFRATLITALFVFACGSLMFWPSAVLLSSAGFIICDFVIGCGLGMIDCGSDPFIMLCGPAKYAQVRFLFSSVIARTGGVVAAIVADKVLVKGPVSAMSLADTQWAYLGMALFVLALAAFLTYWPLPEVCDEELDSDAAYIKGERLTFGAMGRKYVCGWEIVYVTYSLGLLSAICFQGAQSVTSIFSSDYLRSVAPNSALSAAHIDWLGRTAVVVGRSLALIGCLFVRSSWVFLAFYVGLVLVSILSLVAKGDAGIVVILLIQLFGGPIWPFQFVMSLTGFGRATKLGSTVLVATAAAAAIFPAITYAVQRRETGPDYVQSSFRVMVACTCIGMVMPVFISLSTTARKQIHRP
jgi:fucose permease